MDRLCVFYEKLRRVVWQGIRVSAVCTACYGWWGVIYPELAMLPSTYEIVYEEQAEETKTVQKDAEVVEWNSDSQIYWKILEAAEFQVTAQTAQRTRVYPKCCAQKYPVFFPLNI